MQEAPEAPHFPRELLKRPPTERREFFKNHTVMHTAMGRACDELMSIVLEPSNTSLVFLVGPTGGGKTTLRRLIENKIANHLMAEMLTDGGLFSSVSVEVPAPESNHFPWKDFYKRVLREMDEPLIEHKVNYGVRGIHRTNEGHLAISPGISAQELRHAVEQALRHRRPLAVLLDEAQHFLKIASGRKLLDQMDIIKSLANMTNSVQVLIGTYELIPFLNLSGQLSRRSTVVHLPRYHAESEEEIRLFSSTVWDFQRLMPFEEEPNLLEHVQYLYTRSIGCIGVLKDWLNKAYGVALQSKAKTLTMAHLKARAFSITQCRKMLEEARRGEEKLIEAEAGSEKLMEELGIKVLHCEPAGKQPEKVSAKPKTPRKPGQRIAHRDPIGTEQYAA